jgi:hypothetical protein
LIKVELVHVDCEFDQGTRKQKVENKN